MNKFKIVSLCRSFLAFMLITLFITTLVLVVKEPTNAPIELMNSLLVSLAIGYLFTTLLHLAMYREEVKVLTLQNNGLKADVRIAEDNIRKEQLLTNDAKKLLDAHISNFNRLKENVDALQRNGVPVAITEDGAVYSTFEVKKDSGILVTRRKGSKSEKIRAALAFSIGNQIVGFDRDEFILPVETIIAKQNQRNQHNVTPVVPLEDIKTPVVPLEVDEEQN